MKSISQRPGFVEQGLKTVRHHTHRLPRGTRPTHQYPYGAMRAANSAEQPNASAREHTWTAQVRQHVVRIDISRVTEPHGVESDTSGPDFRANVIPAAGCTVSPELLEHALDTIRTRVASLLVDEAVQAQVLPPARSTVVTVSSPAVSGREIAAYGAAGFRTNVRLSVLAHDLDDVPNAPNLDPAHARLRRGSPSEVTDSLSLDRLAFPPRLALSSGAFEAARLATPAHRYRTGTDPDGRGLGYAITGRAGRRGYLQRLAVHPDHQGLGLGAALVIDALRWCRRWQVRRVVVNTQVENIRALSLYRRIGFADVDIDLQILERLLVIGGS